MWSLSALDKYTRDLPDEKRTISLDRKLDIGLFEELAPNLQKSGFTPAGNIEFRIKTTTPLRGQAHGENIDLPTGGTPAFTDVSVPLREIVDVATITKQALDRATGMPGSWGSAVDDAQGDMINISFKEVLQYCAVGNGTGLLARIEQTNNAVTNPTATSVKFFCDNTSDEFGWDNTKMIQVGMQLEIASSAGTTYTDTSWAASTGTVTAVYSQPRANGTKASIMDANCTSYVTIECATSGIATSLQAGIANGDLVFRAGSVSNGIDSTLYTPYPRGLFYFLNGGMNGAASALLTGMCGSGQTTVYSNYCGKARATYPSLQARIHQGGQSGYLSGSGTIGTPEDWDLSDLTDAMVAIEEGTGKGRVNLVMCNKQMGLCLARKTKTENSTQVVVTTTGAANAQAVALPRIPKTIDGPDGQPVKLIINKMWPSNSLGLFDTRDITLAQKGSFDYLNLYDKIWGPTKDDRKGNFEAFFGGYMQMYATRCDNMALMQDLADNI